MDWRSQGEPLQGRRSHEEHADGSGGGGRGVLGTGLAGTGQQVEVYVPEGAPRHVDELEPGVGPGDWLLFHDPVLDADGNEIGTAVTRVQLVSAVGGDDLAFVLDCTIELGDGRLMFTGAEVFSHLPTSVRYAVSGGTGTYAGVTGQVTGTPTTIDGARASLMTFRFDKK